MRHSITFTEADYGSLTGHLYQTGSEEQAAYLLCSLSITASESRLLVKRVIPVLPEEIISISRRHMEIAPQSFMRAMKRADAEHLSFVFVHSHPDGTVGHSLQDDITEQSLFRTAYNRITAEGVRAQVIESCNPTQAEELRRQQYAPELQNNAPAVIAFTTAVASTAVGELLHRLTGFMGLERTTSEVIHFFDESGMRTNHVLPGADCFCGDRQRWGLGDQQPFLGMLWQE